MDEAVLQALMRPAPAAPHENGSRLCARCDGPACRGCGVKVGDNLICRDCAMALHDVLLQARARMTAAEVPWIAGALGALAGAVLWERIAVVFGVNSPLVGLGVAWIVAATLMLATGGQRGPRLQKAAAWLTLGSQTLGLLLQKHSLLTIAIERGAVPPLAPLPAWIASLQNIAFVHPLVWVTMLLSPLIVWRLLALPPAPYARPVCTAVSPVMRPEPALIARA